MHFFYIIIWVENETEWIWPCIECAMTIANCQTNSRLLGVFIRLTFLVSVVSLLSTFVYILKK